MSHPAPSNASRKSNRIAARKEIKEKEDDSLDNVHEESERVPNEPLAAAEDHDQEQEEEELSDHQRLARENAFIKQKLAQQEVLLKRLLRTVEIGNDHDSPTSSSSPVTVPMRVPSRKLPLPPSFSGSTGSDLERWIGDMDRYLDALGDQAPQDARQIAPWLTDAAGQWWNLEGKILATDWEDMKNELRKRFLPITAAHQARADIDRIYQGERRIRDYTKLMLDKMQYLVENGKPMLSEFEKMHLYKSHMAPHIQRAVTVSNPTNLHEMIRAAEVAESTYGTQRKRDGTGRNFNSFTSSSSNSHKIPYGSKSFTRGYERSTVAAAALEDTRLYTSEYGRGPEERKYYMHGEEYGIRAGQHQGKDLEGLHAFDGKRSEENYRSSSSSSGYVPQSEIIELMREGRCFLCKERGHTKRICPRLNRSSSSSYSHQSKK